MTADLLEAATSCAKHRGRGDRARMRSSVGGSSARSAIASAASVERPAQRAGFARLDNTANYLSPRGEKKSRRERHRLQQVLRYESSLPRVRNCGRRRAGFGGVGVFKAEHGAYFGNVQTCGSIHSCAVCSAKLRQRRAMEIDAAVRQHLERGWTALFWTATLPHDFGDELSHLLTSVARAFSRVIGGRGWLEDKKEYAVSGTIRASETTHGKAGWHPHLHVILFCDRKLSSDEVLSLHARLFDRWSAAVEAIGYRAPLIGLCPIERVSARVLGAYVTKMVLTEDSNRKLGMEMTRNDLKRRRGRTPFHILRDFAASGDYADLELWREWERASKGTRALTWSKGLKARYHVEEKADEELAAESVGGVLLLNLTIEQWNLVNSEPMGQVEVLEVAEDQGEDGVRFWIWRASINQRARLMEISPRARSAA